MNRSAVLLAVLILMLSFLPNTLWAGEKATNIEKTAWPEIFSDIVGRCPVPGDLSGNDNAEQKSRPNLPKNWEFGVGMQRFVASHTSYEFGLNNPPWTKPLSRLEFPVNTWWLNFDLRRTCPRWSVGGRAGLSVNRNSNKMMKDSDWDTVGSENVMSNYSKSYCDIRQAYLFRGDVDVNISDWLGLPPSLEIRPLFAFQFQRYSIMTHDGIQWDYDTGNVSKLPGNTLSFRQDWWLYMIGLRGSYDLKMNKYMTVKIKGEADWGPALGYNVDHHIIRGDRFTYDKTIGSALYFLTGLDMVVSKTVTIGVGIDYLRIRTTGEHRLDYASAGQDVNSSDGVKVWSDQLGLIARISYAF
jgi:hypothetical protein